MDARFQQLEQDFLALIDKPETLTPARFAEGSVITGKVVGKQPRFLLVNAGYKSEGRIPLDEFEGLEVPEIGTEITAFVDQIIDEEGLLFLSKEKADRIKVWDEIEKIAEGEAIVRGKIIGKVKGGLSVDIGIKAFLPGSQVDLRPIKDLGEFIGQEHDFKILKHNRMRNNIVLSRRSLLEEERAVLRHGTLEKLEEGATLPGTVKNITDYGAFIDLGGVDGLLHITDMSWGRITHPDEILKVGEDIQVKVLSFDPESERVSLGIKQLTEDPWNNIQSQYPIGSIHTGKVVSITDYGTFVELVPGIEGLVHVSEMSWTEKNVHPSRLVSIDQEVNIAVQNIEIENRRISLSIKDTEPNPWIEVAEQYKPGTIIEGEIKSITDFGVFVGIRSGIDGLVHVSDISWTKRISHPREMFKKGDTVRAVVLNVDVENERFSLGMRQLLPNPWDHLLENCPPGTKVTGKITQQMDFGLFVEIYDGIEGLVHVSQIEEDKTLDEYSTGEEIEVRILSIDALEHKVSLSLRVDTPASLPQNDPKPVSDLERQIKANILGVRNEEEATEE